MKHTTDLLVDSPLSASFHEKPQQNLMALFDNEEIDSLVEALSSGHRLNGADAMHLYQHSNLMGLGELARKVGERKTGDQVYYNINRHVNPTNICVYSCRFCSYAKKPGDDGAYAYSTEDIVEKTREAAAQGADEIHMVGGLHPRWNLKHFLGIIAAIKEEAPQIHLKGFTAVELWWLAKKARLSLKETLIALKQAGLDSLPGGGAEIFHPDIRQKITAKMSADAWLETHKIAHDLGMQSNATMLYGHVEKPEHRVDHMLRLRDLQDQTKGFNAFIPLAFQPHDNQMGIKDFTLGTTDLRTLAIARLILDNFRYIKAYWIMLGKDIAQIAPYFGANDLDGTVTEEKIAKAAGGRSGDALSSETLHAMIAVTGKIPTRRDSIYHRFAPSTSTTKPPEIPAFSELMKKISSSENGAVDHTEVRWWIRKHGPRLLSPDLWYQTLKAAQAVTHQACGSDRYLRPYVHAGDITDATPNDSLIRIPHHKSWQKELSELAARGYRCLMRWDRDLANSPSSQDFSGLHALRFTQIPSESEFRFASELIRSSTEVTLPLKVNKASLSSQLLTDLSHLDHLAGSLPQRLHLSKLVVEVVFTRPDEWMSTELIQCLALIRLAITSPRLGVSMTNLPVMNSPGKNTKTQHPQEKILGLCAMTSVSDFGFIAADLLDQQATDKIFSYAGLHWLSHG